MIQSLLGNYRLTLWLKENEMKIGSMERYVLFQFKSLDEVLKMGDLIDAQYEVYLSNFRERIGNSEVTSIPGSFLCRTGCFKLVMNMKDKGLLEEVDEYPHSFRLRNLEEWEKTKELYSEAEEEDDDDYF